jgi:hypothetical protein
VYSISSVAEADGIIWAGLEEPSNNALTPCVEEVADAPVVKLGVDDPDIVGVGVGRSAGMALSVLVEEAAVSAGVVLKAGLVTSAAEGVVLVDGAGLVGGVAAPGVKDGCAGGPVSTLGAAEVGVANATVISGMTGTGAGSFLGSGTLGWGKLDVVVDFRAVDTSLDFLKGTSLVGELVPRL